MSERSDTRDVQVATVSLDGEQRPFSFRPASPADCGTLAQVFRDEDYDVSPFAVSAALHGYLAAQRAQGLRPAIVDLGANIGASSVWFLCRYPDAWVCAVEPEPGNHALLVANTQGLDVVALQAAASSSHAPRYLVDPGRGDWGFQTAGQGEVPVPVVTLPDILARLPADSFPFLCKIDIEGAEGDLFLGDCAWLDRFALVICELHDWLLPGQGTSRPLLRNLAARDFDVLIRSENLYCFNNRLIRDDG